jgi:hypothetical protein
VTESTTTEACAALAIDRWELYRRIEAEGIRIRMDRERHAVVLPADALDRLRRATA